ncbi:GLYCOSYLTRANSFERASE [Salix viminalis]|uniref:GLYCOSYLTRANSFERASE n=1 Tax=Salix viminalis TaxID=40686 RepID=A0A9Q0UGI1_SALVM|nr:GLYCOSYLTRANSFERASE [Salix viminalis]
MAQPDSPAHVAILPSPGMGHLIPLAELAKRLVHQHNLSITFVIPTDGSPSKAQRSVLGSLPSTIRSVFLPPVNLSDLPEDVKIETTISLTVARSLPSLRDVFREMKEPVKIPGCLPIHGGELLDPAQDRKNDAYKWLLHHTKRYRLAEGVMVNSFTDLEKGALQALREVEAGKPAVYPVGPLVNMDSSTGGEGSDQCLKWLDDQPHGSVLFVSFGSGGTLSLDQITELALGLETNQRPADNGLIGREEIANVVRGLMEGEEGKRVRNRMKDLKEAAARVLLSTEDGSLSELARRWKNQKWN